MRGLKHLHPGYFALVMATGIISLAAWGLGMTAVAQGLLFANRLAFAALSVLTLLRLAVFAAEVRADLADSVRAPAFLTWVAALSVLGGQEITIAGDWTGASLLWAVAVVLWAGLVYALALALITGEVSRQPGQGPNGGWLLTVVATQGISSLGSLLAPGFGTWSEAVLQFSTATFLLGCMLYILVMSLIAQHFVQHRSDPATFSPPFWIMMGASAITTLAGAQLVIAGAGWPFLARIQPFVEGLTLLFWVMATWLAPLLVLLGVWRHVYHRVALRYDPQFWAMVFPLGMYTACTLQLARVTGVPLLFIIPSITIYLALGAWLLTLIGMVRHLAKNLPVAVMNKAGSIPER